MQTVYTIQTTETSFLVVMVIYGHPPATLMAFSNQNQAREMLDLLPKLQMRRRG